MFEFCRPLAIGVDPETNDRSHIATQIPSFTVSWLESSGEAAIVFPSISHPVLKRISRRAAKP